MKIFLAHLLFFCFLFNAGFAEALLPQENEKSIVPINNQINEFDVRLALARIYSKEKETEEASLRQYLWLLSKKPDDIDIVIEASRLYLKGKNWKEGLNLLYFTLSKDPYNIKLLVAAAQAEAKIGHAEISRDLFLKALSLKTDDKILIEFANSMMGWGDFYKAQQIFSEALIDKPDSLDLYLSIAWSLISQEQYEKGEEIYRKLLLTYPDDPKILEALISLKIQEKKFDEAFCIILTLLKTSPKNLSYLQLKAEILFLNKNYEEAILGFKELQNDSKYSLKAYIGMGKAYKKIDRYHEAAESFERAYQINPKSIEAKFYKDGIEVFCIAYLDDLLSFSDDIEDLKILADLYIQKGMARNALAVYEAILNRDSEYFAAKVGVAEMQGVLYRFCESFNNYQVLLNQFPENIKLMVAAARVVGWSKHYKQSIGYYNEILKVNPNDTTLYREKARTALWGKQFCLAMKTYNQLLIPLEKDVDPPFADQHIKTDYLSDPLIQHSIRLEKHAKTLVWNKRYIHSLNAYEDLLNLNPGNEEAIFDFGQSYCNLRLCDQSRDVYLHLLDIDPMNSLAQKVLDRSDVKLMKSIQTNLTYWREIGSGSFSQSQIARYRLDTVFEQPIFCCNAHLRFMQQEYVENPFYNYKFYPAEGQAIEADYLINKYVSIFASATYKTYFHRFKSTITGYNRLLFNMNDYLQVVLECSRENEIYNYFSLKQAIQSFNSKINVSSNINHYWTLTCDYQHYHYNDHNDQNYINLISEYQFTEEPHIFKVILQGNYRNTNHQSVSIIVNNKLVDVIHPYWTPDKYFSGTATFEYRYDYRFFVFCGAAERYVDFKIIGGTDNTNNPSIEVVFEWKHEFDNLFGIEVKAMIHRSPLWNAEGMWATLSYRF